MSSGSSSTNERLHGEKPRALYGVREDLTTLNRAEEMHVRRGFETILLVEDESSVREIIALLLKRLGYRVQEASSGEDGLRLAQGSQEKINLLITDLLMPGMSGRELAQALRARDTSLKVLFLSGHTGDPGVHLGFEPTEVTFLQKPFALDALSKKLKEILDER